MIIIIIIIIVFSTGSCIFSVDCASDPVQLKKGRSPGRRRGGARRPHAISRRGRRRWGRGDEVKVPKPEEGRGQEEVGGFRGGKV